MREREIFPKIKDQLKLLPSFLSIHNVNNWVCVIPYTTANQTLNLDERGHWWSADPNSVVRGNRYDTCAGIVSIVSTVPCQFFFFGFILLYYPRQEDLDL